MHVHKRPRLFSLCPAHDNECTLGPSKLIYRSGTNRREQSLIKHCDNHQNN